MNFSLIVHIWHSLFVIVVPTGWTVPDCLIYCYILSVIQHHVTAFQEFLTDDLSSHCFDYCFYRVKNLSQTGPVQGFLICYSDFELYISKSCISKWDSRIDFKSMKWWWKCRRCQKFRWIKIWCPIENILHIGWEPPLSPFMGWQSDPIHCYCCPCFMAHFIKMAQNFSLMMKKKNSKPKEICQCSKSSWYINA